MTELTAMIDTSSCDREPIHILGLTQEFGAVIATSLDWNITHYSENIFELLGLANASVLGEPLGKLLPKAAQQQIQQAASRLGAEQEVEQLFGITLSTYKDNRFVVRLHRNGDHLIIDIEPDLEGLPDAGSSLIKLQSNINRLRLEESITDRAQSTAELVKALTGFDRVMIYKFIENDDGQVIAEALEPDMEPYLGLRYPASDIPKQARELYKRSPIRVIADVSDKGCAILPAKGPDGKPLDLSLSMIRSVSPVHLVYLRNMGVAASMSVSLLVQDRLWGLIACHHNTPFLPDPRLRAAAEVVGHFFALSLDELETKEDQEARDKAQTVHDKVVVHFSHDANIIDGFNTLVSATRQALDFDGAMVWINDRFDATGTALTEEEFKALLPVLNRTANGRQFITDHLVSIHPEATSYADRVSGIIVIPISRQPRDYLVFCRKEQVIDLLWAGDPTKQVVQDPKHAKLMPRNSFAAWQETRRMHSTPWSKGDERLATGLRITLLEIALRMSDATLV
ncbi:MAG: GAF domain-containing protein, partial [Pseudomonadota bacterium]